MNVYNITEFIKKLTETPYIWWKEGDKINYNAPFWAENSKITDNDIDLIKKRGCNSAGFINILCRFLNLQIPGLSLGLPNAGGVYCWFEYLKSFGVLEQFKQERNYPPGTLLLRQYTNSMDTGHISIVLDNMKLAHSYPDVGICIDESYYISHNWLPDGYYTHVCLPQKWIESRLLKNY